MPFKLRAVVKDFESLSELGRQIHKEWKELAPSRAKGKVPTATGIATRLGELERDATTAWDTDEYELGREAFTKVTGFDFRKLPRSRGEIASSGFPALPPFVPGGDLPPLLGAPDWFALPAPTTRRWIVAPPGAGRSFAVAWHRLQSVAIAFEVPTLSDVALPDEEDPQPLIVAVDRENGSQDLAASERLADRGGVLVMAPFPPPTPPRDDSASEQAPAWEVTAWRALPGWRRELVDHIASRLEKTSKRLDAEALAKTFDAIDPDCRAFAVPGDVISICAFVHARGLAALEENVAANYVESTIRDASASEHDGSTWLRAHGADQLTALVGARLADIRLPWRGPLPRETWVSLLPPDAPPVGPTDAEIDAALRKTSGVLTEVRKLLSSRDPGQQFELLCSARLIKVDVGGFSVQPGWLAEDIAQRALLMAFQSDSPASWGRLSVDPVRRELVDAALDSLGDSQLASLARQVATAFDRCSLGSVAAVETLFSAVAWRLHKHREDGDWSTFADLGALWEAQRTLLTTRYSDGLPLEPTTRPGYNEGSDWIVDCWAWSFYGPKVVGDPPAAWLFPGWAHLSLEELAPLHRHFLGMPSHSGPTLQPTPRPFSRRRDPFLRLLEMADAVVDRCPDAEVPADLPVALAPSVILRAHGHTPRWSVPSKSIADLLSTSWGDRELSRRFEALSPEEKASVADDVFSALASGAGDRMVREDRLSAVGRMAEHLKPSAVLQALRPAVIPLLLQSIFKLPAKVRSPVVAFALDNCPDQLGALDVPMFGSPFSRRRAVSPATDADVDWIEDVATRGQARWPFQQELWRLAPVRARERACLPLESDVAKEWLFAAPATEFGRLLDHLEGKRLPPWALVWLRRRVQDAGADADRAYAMLMKSG